jgi:hypothetical protein
MHNKYSKKGRGGVIKPFTGVKPSVVVYGHATLENTSDDPRAGLIIERLIDGYNEDRHLHRQKPTNSPDELKVPSNENIHDIALFLASPVLKRFGLGTALVDSRTASTTERRTEATLDRLEDFIRIGHVGCAFVVYGHHQDNLGHFDRQEDIRRAVLGHDIPTLELEAIEPAQYMLDAQETPSGINELFRQEQIFVPHYI